MAAMSSASADMDLFGVGDGEMAHMSGPCSSKSEESSKWDGGGELMNGWGADGEEDQAGEEQEGSKGTKEKEDPWVVAMKQLDQDNLVRGKVGLLVNQRYQIVSKISFGSYGAIFVADDSQNPGKPQVAVKFEGRRDGEADVHLNYENNVYQSVQGSTGVARVHWFGREFDHEIMVMDLLGPTLEQLFTFCGRRFSVQTVVGLGQQMLERIRHLHDRGFVHRDIKPENFLMGVGFNQEICYLIDFGLARRYRFRRGKQLCHIPFRRGKNLVGTARYASLNSHNGFELSRRDDLESLAYVLIEFVIGELPWKENRTKTRYRPKKQLYNRIKYSKENIEWNELCPSLAAWVRYCRQLPFDAPPDYQFLHDQLNGMLSSAESSQQPSHLNNIHHPGDFGFTNGHHADPTDIGGNPFQHQSAMGHQQQSQYQPQQQQEICIANQRGFHYKTDPQCMSNGAARHNFGGANAAAFGGNPNSSANSFGSNNRLRSSNESTFDWIKVTRNSEERRYAFECLFRWTLPKGQEPRPPPDHWFGSFSFGFRYQE